MHISSGNEPLCFSRQDAKDFKNVYADKSPPLLILLNVLYRVKPLKNSSKYKLKTI